MILFTSIAIIVLGYAAGSVPWGVVLGRIFSSTDLRAHGSGATGTTNAYRILGWRISVAVLVLDFGKGMLPVLIGRMFGLNDWIVAAAGVAAVIGHCWSPFIGFHGGKGMATGAGASIAMLPWLLAVFPLMVAIVIRWRYVSLASLVGTATATGLVTLAAMENWTSWPVVAASVAITGIIILQHRGNIQRLLAGNERRLTRRPTAS